MRSSRVSFWGICRIGIAVFLAAMVAPSLALAEYDLRADLGAARNSFDIPGLAAAVVIDGQIVMVASSGVRKSGSDAAVQEGDAFQICSVTKPITATLAYILSEKNILPITSKITDVFPELAAIMRPEYRDVNIEMLLTHRAGFPYMPKTEPGDEFLSVSSSMMKRRYEYVKAALIDKPECTPGEKMVYGGGTIILAAMMEKKTGKLWEQLVREYIFNPLQMKTAGFGAMSKTDVITGVWEHSEVKGDVVPAGWPDRYDKEVHAPAGRNVHMSAGDLAKFMIASFPNNDRPPRILGRKSQIKMQQVVGDGPTSPGWFVSIEGWSDWKTVAHLGNNGKSISTLMFAPKHNSGFVLVANVSGKKAVAGLAWIGEKLKTYIKEEVEKRNIRPRLSIASSALSLNKPVTASNYYYNNPTYAPSAALDGILASRWATDDPVKDAWIEVDLKKVETVQSMLVKEEFFPRVDSFELLARSSATEKFKEIARGTRLGDEFTLNVPAFKARYVRLVVHTRGKLGPTISEFHVFGGRIN